MEISCGRKTQEIARQGGRKLNMQATTAASSCPACMVVCASLFSLVCHLILHLHLPGAFAQLVGSTLLNTDVSGMALDGKNWCHAAFCIKLLASSLCVHLNVRHASKIIGFIKGSVKSLRWSYHLVLDILDCTGMQAWLLAQTRSDQQPNNEPICPVPPNSYLTIFATQ